MRLLYVPLSADMLARLCHLAARERREPREQAAYLLEHLLEPLVSSGPSRTDEGACDTGSGHIAGSSPLLAHPTDASQRPGVDLKEPGPAPRQVEEEASDEPRAAS
jgi:hypothetical protein